MKSSATRHITGALLAGSLLLACSMFLVATAPHAEAQLTPVDPSQQRAQDLAARLADKYDSIQTMKAQFVQIVTSQFMDDPERFSGLLIFSQNQYRIETSTQTIVTDGTTTWIHNRGKQQVLITDFVEDETSFSLTSFLRNFDEEYDVRAEGQESLSGTQHDILFLTPRDDFSAFRSVRLWIRRRDLIVTRLLVIDLNDVTMTFDLSEITVNPELDSKTFAFQIPADVEIIDLRN